MTWLMTSSVHIQNHFYRSFARSHALLSLQLTHLLFHICYSLFDVIFSLFLPKLLKVLIYISFKYFSIHFGLLMEKYMPYCRVCFAYSIIEALSAHGQFWIWFICILPIFSSNYGCQFVSLSISVSLLWVLENKIPTNLEGQYLFDFKLFSYAKSKKKINKIFCKIPNSLTKYSKSKLNYPIQWVHPNRTVDPWMWNAQWIPPYFQCMGCFE